MTGLLAADLLMLLRLNKRGIITTKGRYRTGLICSLIADLINLNRINLKERDDGLIFIKAAKGEMIGTKILDEIYLTIRDCPKEYSINDWVDRFVESFDVYEELMIESLIHREILLPETKKERLGRLLIAIILFIPCCFPGSMYYNSIAKPIHYKVKTPNLKFDNEQQLINNLKSFEMPNPSLLGLIIVLKTTGLFRLLLNTDIDDYLTKKFYQLQDHDFLNQDMELLVRFLRDKYNPKFSQPKQEGLLHKMPISET